VGDKPKLSRPLVVAFALVFLFETWIWGAVVAGVRALVRLVPWESLKQSVQRFVNRMPAIVALLMFGVPLVVSEVGSFFSVLLIATGHFLMGAAGYILMKVLALGLVAAVFDLCREKLMTIPWFVYLYDKFNLFHDFAHRLIAPYRESAAAFLRALREWARAQWARGIGATRREPG
jgi:hypothetical protein